MTSKHTNKIGVQSQIFIIFLKTIDKTHFVPHNFNIKRKKENKKMSQDCYLTMKKFHTVVTVDKEDGIILGYDINQENDEPLLHTEGKIKEICKEMASEIEKHFDIKVKDFGVDIIEEIYDVDAKPDTTSYYTEEDEEESKS